MRRKVVATILLSMSKEAFANFCELLLFEHIGGNCPEVGQHFTLVTWAHHNKALCPTLNLVVGLEHLLSK